jgi:ADP-L-glycero-D-manno-heptose 6-epimerase
MRYLVTGAAGFIGARFVESCRARAIDVVSVDSRAHFAERPEHKGLDFGPIVDRDELDGWLKGPGAGEKFDAIVHLGACTDTSQLDVAYLERVNVRASQRLWDEAVARKIPLVYASSAATYGAGEAGYGDDEASLARLRPLNPYGESKHRFDLWALERERAGHRPPAWSAFKFFNVYGFGERHKRRMASVVLHSFDQIRATGESTLFKSHREGIADGQQKRDFVFVEDVVEVLHFAATKPIARGIYNLGTGRARAFHDLARAVFAALGLPERIRFVDTPENLRAHYQYFTEAKMEKLHAQGFVRPFATLEEGASKYVARLISIT